MRPLECLCRGLLTLLEGGVGSKRSDSKFGAYVSAKSCEWNPIVVLLRMVGRFLKVLILYIEPFAALTCIKLVAIKSYHIWRKLNILF